MNFDFWLLFPFRGEYWKEVTLKTFLISGASVAVLIVFLVLIYAAFDLQSLLPQQH
jgi:hypothetical protein